MDAVEDALRCALLIAFACFHNLMYTFLIVGWKHLRSTLTLTNVCATEASRNYRGSVGTSFSVDIEDYGYGDDACNAAELLYERNSKMRQFSSMAVLLPATRRRDTQECQSDQAESEDELSHSMSVEAIFCASIEPVSANLLRGNASVAERSFQPRELDSQRSSFAFLRPACFGDTLSGGSIALDVSNKLRKKIQREYSGGSISYCRSWNSRSEQNSPVTSPDKNFVPRKPISSKSSRTMTQTARIAKQNKDRSLGGQQQSRQPAKPTRSNLCRSDQEIIHRLTLSSSNLNFCGAGLA